jgi:TolB-like protein
MEGEFGTLLLKAGFPLVDAKSDRKPDIEITGGEIGSAGPRLGDLYSYFEVLNLKVQERRSGSILAMELQISSASENSAGAAQAAAPVNAVEAMADKLLPVLAGQPAPAMFAKEADAPKSPLTVAVYDFSGDADAARYVNKLAALVTADLAGATNLVMVERAELNKALTEQAFGVSGMVNSDAAAQIGKITGAKVLVSGQVIRIGDNHLILLANIVGTESGRLFAAKAEGAADNLPALTDELSRKIAQTISDQTANLTAEPRETSAEALDRIIKSLPGTNRSSVSVYITYFNNGAVHESKSIEAAFGSILLRAGFPVVDARSERKPDIEITGTELAAAGPRQGDLYSYTEPLDIKVQERMTGKILAAEHQVGAATDAAHYAAMFASEVNAVDLACEKILPLLTK